MPNPLFEEKSSQSMADVAVTTIAGKIDLWIHDMQQATSWMDRQLDSSQNRQLSRWIATENYEIDVNCNFNDADGRNDSDDANDQSDANIENDGNGDENNFNGRNDFETLKMMLTAMKIISMEEMILKH